MQVPIRFTLSFRWRAYQCFSIK